MIKQALNSLTVHGNLWTLKIDNFSEFQNVISDNPTPPPPSRHPRTLFSRIAHKNRYVTHPFTNFQFLHIQQNQDCSHQSSEAISLIKRRIEYLTKALLARFSKIIMFFKFPLEKVSQRFENDYIHDIGFFWPVNIDKTGPILAVYCV